MRPHIVQTIFRKELVETLRDRRTLLMMVGLPVLLYPLLLIGFSKLQESESEAREERTSRVAVWGQAPADLLAQVRGERGVTLLLWAGAPSDLRGELEAGRLQAPLADADQGRAGQPRRAGDAETPRGRRGLRALGPASASEQETPIVAAARQAIAGRAVDAVLVAWPGLDEALAEGRAGRVSIYFDSVSEDSAQAAERVQDRLDAFRRALVARRQQERHLDRGFATAVDVTARNVAV